MGDSATVSRRSGRAPDAGAGTRRSSPGRHEPAGPRPTTPGLREATGIWGVVGVLTAAVFLTYALVPVGELYHVSGTGLVGGASRVVTYLNYPIAFLATALLGFAVARLLAVPDALPRAGRWAAGLVGVLALGLCLVAGWPGVVDDGNLDARAVNALPALGVALAAGLTVLAVLRTGLGPRRPWIAWDWARLGVVLVVAVLALPWILADVGVYVGDVPLLGRLFISKEILAGDPLPAVHLGEHHGLDGALLAAAALFLMRPLGQVKNTWLRAPLAAYLALMLVYGLANAAQDLWLEQVVKRGWAVREIPSVLKPGVTPAWGIILLVTAAVAALLLFGSRRRRAEA